MTVPEQPDTLMHRPMSSTAQRIREQVATVNPEFMNSLKYYLNHVEDPTKVCPPVHRMTSGCVLWSDWNRVSDRIDFGYGKKSRMCRSWVNPSHMPVVIMTPTPGGAFDLTVQLDPESMND